MAPSLPLFLITPLKHETYFNYIPSISDQSRVQIPQIYIPYPTSRTGTYFLSMLSNNKYEENELTCLGQLSCLLVLLQIGRKSMAHFVNLHCDENNACSTQEARFFLTPPVYGYSHQLQR